MPSGGGQPAQTTQISKVELPAWVDKASQENYQMAKNVSDRPFAQYQGSRVADPSQYTTQGYDQIQANIGAANPYVDAATGAYNKANSLYDDSASMYKSTAPLYDQAQGQFGKASSVLDQSMPLFGQAADIYRSTAGPLDINQFLNPYTNEVEQRAIGNANTALTQQMAGNASAAEKAGAFGGSRFAVQQGVTQGEGVRNIGDLSAQLRRAGIDFATQTALQDRTGRQAAAGGLLNTAGGMGGASDRYMNTGTGYLNTAAGIRDTAAGIGSTAGGVAGTGTGYLGAANTKLSGN